MVPGFSLVMSNVLQGMNPTFVRVLLLRGRMQVRIRHSFWLLFAGLVLLLCKQCSCFTSSVQACISAGRISIVQQHAVPMLSKIACKSCYQHMHAESLCWWGVQDDNSDVTCVEHSGLSPEYWQSKLPPRSVIRIICWECREQCCLERLNLKRHLSILFWMALT